MTFSYSGDPSASNTDAVRFLVGDTDTKDQLLSDEEIAYLLGRDSRVLGASALACEAIAYKLIRRVKFRLGPLSEDHSSLNMQYLAAAKKFRVLAVTADSFVAGAIKLLDKQANESDTAVVPARFLRDQFAHRRHKPLVRELALLL